MPRFIELDKLVASAEEPTFDIIFPTLPKMADSEYTDDETEYDSPSDSQAVVMVGLLHFSLFLCD